MDKFQHEGIVAVFRPSDGHYRIEDDWRVLAEVFQDHPVTGSELRKFVLDRIWDRITHIETIVGVPCTVQGFTRPILHILIDLLGTFGRAKTHVAVTHAKELFGDRGGDFLALIDHLHLVHTPNTIDEMLEFQNGGALHVGPLPAFSKNGEAA